jgi:4-amino-4-deoxy-L-arabinose transferase-like glycosyltransferase
VVKRHVKWTRVKSSVSVIVLALLSNTLILWDPSRLLVFAAGLVLVCLLPGYLLARVILPGGDALKRSERVVLSIGLGYAVLVLGTLTLHYLPGPLTRLSILALYDGLILLLVAVFLWRRRDDATPSAGRLKSAHSLLLLAVLLVAAFLRFGNLGYSEFQGDESRAALMAAAVVRGQEEILFLHKKGPVEILVPAVFYALDGTLDELTARLPFALANVTAIATMYLLIRRLFPHQALAAPIAAGLLAVDGYLTAFGRLLQYQSVVFLMVALAAWSACVWRRERHPTLISLAALFLAVGALAHYEALLAAPFVAWTFWDRGRHEKWPIRQWIQQAWVPIAVAALVLGAFYVPFVRHPHFAETAEYITERRIGGGLLYNQLYEFFYRATFYNSVYYVLFLLLGMLLFVMDRLRMTLRSFGLAVGVVLFLGMAAVAAFPQAFVVGELNLAVVPFAATLLLLIMLPRIDAEVRAALLWFSASCLIALFLMQKPKTHVYTMFPAGTALIGLTFSRIITGLDRRVGRLLKATWVRRVGLLLIGAAVLAVFGFYIYIVFVRHAPDFRRGYPDTRPAFYPTFYGDESPKGGGFGFPHRGGWKAIGTLYAQGVLQGSYSANEEAITTSWYVRGVPWCRDAADYYFIASIVHDREKIPEDRIRRDNHLLGRVWSDGRSVLEIYGLQPVDEPTDYDLADLEGVFDDATHPDVWLWALEPTVPGRRVDARVGEWADLLGADMSDQVVAGETMALALHWQPVAAFDGDYTVFVHVEVEGKELWGQHDAIPVCGSMPTTDWESGETVIDGHFVPIDPATPPGEYPVIVGMYDRRTGERLPVSGDDANEWGNAIHLGTVQVLPPAGAQESAP